MGIRDEFYENKIYALEEKLRVLQSEFDACHLTKNIVRDTLEKTEEKLRVAEGALRDIANDRSPPWDKTDYQRLTREALAKIKAP